jgi:threonine synthase
MWRYIEALPDFGHRVSLGEGYTPLVPLAVDGINTLAKCEFGLPSGSYKDRGSATLMSYLRSLGAEEAVEDSSGNAGASLAAYAARACVPLKIFCPADAPSGKLLQIRLAGADLVKVPGPRPRATEALLQYLAQHDAIYASHLWHPMFVEGIKTLAFELAEQLAWRAPAAIVFPVGAGSILLGLYRGFTELLDAGIVSSLPLLVAVQAEKNCALHKAFTSGAEEISEIPPPQNSLADGLAASPGVHGPELLRALKESHGIVVTVSEAEIIDGVKALGNLGFCVEPTTAVIWHGARHARQLLTGAGDVVVVLSGNGLKAAQAIDGIL